MPSVREQMERAAEAFRPREDWLEGATQRAGRRQRRRRFLTAVVALTVFAASFTGLWLALHPAVRPAPAGVPACERTWSQGSPEPSAGGFTAVSGTAIDDVWAVGPSEEFRPGSETIIQHWDGTAWTRLPSANGATGPGAVNELYGVVAISPEDAWAVGQYVQNLPVSSTNPTRILIEHWDGTRWSLVPAPNPSERENSLNAVAAAGKEDVWAVGHSVVGTRSTILVEHWDGTRWSVVPTPDLMTEDSGASLDAIAVVSADDIWAVGSQPAGVLIEHWDGSTWSVVDAPQPADHGFLTAVDVSGPDDVWAVGWTTPSDGNEATPPVIEHYDGTGWELVELPAAPARFVVPLAVTAVSSNDVWVTGWMGDSNLSQDYDRHRAMVAHWDGRSWTYEDIGAHRPPEVLEGATKAGETVWFVGSQGGAFDGPNGSLEGELPLAALGRCAT